MEAKEMTKIVFIIAALTSLFAAGAGAQSVNAAANGALSIVSLKISPQPVVAGENVTVVFQLYNSYQNALNNVNLQLAAKNPIINVSPSSTILITSIGQGLYGGGVGFSSFVYTFRIPSTLLSGEYTVDVLANYQTSQPNSYGGSSDLPAESEMPIDFYVYGTPSLQLSASPSSALVPGQSTSIPVTVVNAGTDVANNVTITLHNSKNFSVFGSQKFSLGSINADASSTFYASIQPSLSLSNGTYPVNATISYVAESGSRITENSNIELSMLINPPDIVGSILSADPTNLYAGGNQTLQVQVQDIGLGEAKNITARFLNGPGIDVGSISQFFIASLSPKNSSVVTVYINANRTSPNASFSLPLSLRYYSSNYGGNYSSIQYIPINIQKSALFNITAVEGAPKAGNSYAPLIFTVKNTGNEPAEQITFSLQTTFPITPVNPDEYLDSLAPGQSANITFYVSVDPTGNSGSYPISLFEQWRQPNGAASQQFSGSNGYYAMVGGGSGSGASSYVIYGIVAIVIIAAVIIIRRRLPSKKKA
ncbi:MAG: COG1361 S-layer family protein [Candidatus Micrarchaeaceae archaeon]